ncbi:hypothetical protein [Candidatus Aquarickettsia rohweri]|uniref:Uncharacterized protein n=1 Tax=Candidatus Aquarickettsia rohweri TaxID=2602574 RepID=A0A429XHP2_9RICK|nr:hypothetical protein [Candidatus Aquarickettsia rohweri]RST65213.1 hypothetical protein EIC27_04330 [Candidatus Aquarickettsia rohweri]
MGKVFNVPFSTNFLEQLIKKILKLSNNLENPDSNLIILPHKRIQTAFTQKLSTINSKLLFPKITTFSSIDENLLDFDNYCNNIYAAKISLIKKHLLKQDQLYILILSVINSIKQNNIHKFDTKFLDTVNYSKILKTLDEYYYYQYDRQKMTNSTKIEKLIFVIIESLEKFLTQNNLILKSQTLNFAINEIIRKWDYQNNANIFIILPQTEVSYIKYFIDNLAKYQNSYIFIRGYNKTNNKRYLYQNHIIDFLKRTKITTESIENLTTSKHTDYLIPSILLKNNNEELNLDNLNVIRGKNQNEEAKLIALIIREKLESSSETIVVQTKSERLANLIEGFLKLWDINVENLINKHSKSPISNFFLLIALYLNTENNHYLLLLDILKSMYCKVIETQLVNNFELNYLRKDLYREKVQDYFINASDSEKTSYNILLKIEKKFLETKKLIKNTTLTICEYLQIHLDLFYFLNNQSYNYDFANLISNIKKKLTIFKNKININFDEYLTIIKKLINSNSTNNNYKIAKSVTILQTFENRNIQYSTLIFAGLNEKTFIDLSFDNNFFNKNFRILNNLKPTDSEL